MEILQGCRNLVFAFLVKNDFKCSSVIVYFEQSAHLLFLLGNNSSNNYYLQLLIDTYIIYGFTLNFAHIVRSWRCLLNHFHCYRRKNAVFPFLSSHHILALVFIAWALTHLSKSSKVVSSIVWHKESIIVVSELHRSKIFYLPF